MVASGPTDPLARSEAARVRRQSRVVAGLLLTFAGLLLALGLLPTAEGPLERTIPVLGGALLAIWIGGILLGIARAPRPAAPR